MKATGIVRKVDELGRIVLPIELRRTLNIEIKDPLEIYVDGESIMLKKYQPGMHILWKLRRHKADKRQKCMRKLCKRTAGAVRTAVIVTKDTGHDIKQILFHRMIQICFFRFGEQIGILALKTVDKEYILL